MLSVLICEDDRNYQNILTRYIQDYINMEELDIEIALCTSDPSKIIEYIKEYSVKGIYFLDVALDDGYNGVELAKYIRQYDPRGFIVFITSYIQYMPLTFEYKVEALAYIQKSDMDTVRQKVFECIQNAYQKHVSRADNGYYVFKTQSGRFVSCEYEDILFFETDPLGKRLLILHTKKRHYTIQTTLQNLTAELPAGLFFKTHKSYIVNINSITSSCIDDLNQGKDRMIMPDGTECLVSIRNRRSLQKLLNSITAYSTKKTRLAYTRQTSYTDVIK